MRFRSKSPDSDRMGNYEFDGFRWLRRLAAVLRHWNCSETPPPRSQLGSIFCLFFGFGIPTRTATLHKQDPASDQQHHANQF